MLLDVSKSMLGTCHEDRFVCVCPFISARWRGESSEQGTTATVCMSMKRQHGATQEHAGTC